MTLFEYISANLDRVKAETKAGMHSCTIINDWLIYSTYDIYKKVDQRTVMSVFFVSEKYHISEKKVYRIIKKMEKQVDESIYNKLQPVNPSR